MNRRLPRLSAYQRHRLKTIGAAVLRFSGTVLCSAIVTAWLLDPGGLARRFGGHHGSLWRRPSATYRPSSVGASPIAAASPTGAAPRGNFGERYARYFEEAMPLLRSDHKVRMISMEMPSAILSYQQNAAAHSAGYRLSTVSPRIPVIAVSRNAREFLSTMRITFVDPKALPSEASRGVSLPMTWDKIEDDFVLVPDLTGGHARHFLFTRR